MGCGSSKPEQQSVPMAQPVVMQNGQAVPVQVQQPAAATKKQKAVKAGTNLGFLSILAS
jgi:hypothetical protein